MTTTKIAVAHYCEGAGHASRMLAIVHELESAGYDIVLAGGGPGAAFAEENGYDEFEPPTVDFIGDYQRGTGLLDVLRHSAPAAVDRVRQYRGWLSAESPDLLVTDDISAAIAATVHSQRYVYVSHDPAGIYSNPIERAGARVRNRLARTTAERFLVPKVWSGEPTIPDTEAIPPIAPRCDDARNAVDVLVVPSAYSLDSRRLRESLEDRGRDVTLVGGDDWKVKASLQPYVLGADVVICSGYSTMMESAVAGTPCIVLPATSEQHGVVEAVSDLGGFYPAATLDDVVALLDRVEPPVPRENGAGRVADAVGSIVRSAPTV